MQFKIAVDNLLLVGVVQSIGDLFDNVVNFLNGEGARGIFEECSKIAPVDVIHDQVDLVIFDGQGL